MARSNIDRLLEIMARLRDPERGCPWDVAQSFATIAPYTIEEAYEVADAIARQDLDALREELGDLLLQVVFHARMAEEARSFDFEAVAGAIADKMIRRHPHVFGEEEIKDAETQRQAWEAHKESERAAAAAARGKVGESALDGVALSLPALTRALKLQRRAARVGFDWTETASVLAKIEEEIRELSAELVDRIAARARRGRARRPPLQPGQSCAPARARPGGGAASEQREVRAPFPPGRGLAGRSGQGAERGDAR